MQDKENAVFKRYTNAAKKLEIKLCCPTSYNNDYLKVIPKEIIDKDYGCGDPSQYVRKGETVLDLGSGAGKLCYIMAQVVGKDGKVIGVDMNDVMLSLARKYQAEIAGKLGYNNTVFIKGKIQDLSLDLSKVDEYLKTNPVKSSDDIFNLNTFIEDIRKNSPLITDKSIDVVVSNCVLNLVRPEDKSQLFSEIYRVLKDGGRAVISDIVSDEDVPQYLQDDPELWSGCISGAFREDLFLDAFTSVGFYGVEILKRDETPWQTIDGIEFRSMTVVAYKGKGGPCIDHKEAVIYKGPFRKIFDDDGNIYERGKRIAVCNKTFNILKMEPYKENFYHISPYQEPVPNPFPRLNEIIYRDPRETKGENYLFTKSASSCCGSDTVFNIHVPFKKRLKSLNKQLLKDKITTIQVNIGNLCNQSCIHCHVNASPDGINVMSKAVMKDILQLLKNNSGLTLDITGGSPELHPEIRWFIKSAMDSVSRIILRSNLTALNISNGLLDYLYDKSVELFCSLPYLSEEKTDYQRGKGVFVQSINVLKKLNDMGYGIEKTLNLVHNPIDFKLPQPQAVLEKEFRDTLSRDYDIRFHNLYIINNVPIGRFGKILKKHNSYEQYMNLLSQCFNIDTIDKLMCKYILNIGYDGKLYDCDFNNAIGLNIKKDLWNLNINDLYGYAIKIGEHCYACTALSSGGCFGSVV